MKISTVSIKNFRAIKELKEIDFKKLTMLIGDNGCSKTTILEAIHYCLSPSFLGDRIKPTDFYNGTDDEIEILVEFDDTFSVKLYDGYDVKEEICESVILKIKKRDKAAAKKAFSDGVVLQHYCVPSRPKDTANEWIIGRKNGGDFKFTERQLTFPIETDNLPKTFYFGKDRDKQIHRGFNTSINRVFDDYNWRFARELRKENLALKDSDESFIDRKIALEDEVTDKVDEKLKTTLDALNSRLHSLGLSEVDISIFDASTPFDSAFLRQKAKELEIPVSNLGSGIEMIISLLFLETLSSMSKEHALIIIDEPELHLHPLLQTKFISYLTQLSENHQVILSTHSPYFFKNCLGNPQIELIVTKKDNNEIELTNTGDGTFGIFPWSPSWGEINYVAYSLPSIEFHNELYGYLQDIKNAGSTTLIEAVFTLNGELKSKNWIKQNAVGVAQPAEPVTLMTYIRHSIHHPENTLNVRYTEDELRDSINAMIPLC